MHYTTESSFLLRSFSKKQRQLKMHFCIHSCHFSSKVLQNWDQGQQLKKFCVAAKNSQSEQNCRPHKAFFRAENNQMLHKAR